MKAKLVKESLNKSDRIDISNMMQQIASAVYITYNGDDVEYKINEKDIEDLENLIKNTIDTSKLKDEDGESIKYFDIFADEEWLYFNLKNKDVIKLYNAMKDANSYF